MQSRMIENWQSFHKEIGRVVPPKTELKSKMSEIPNTSFAKSRESPLTSEIPTTSTQEDNSNNKRNKGIVAYLDSNAGGVIWPDGFDGCRPVYFNLLSEKELGIKLFASVSSYWNNRIWKWVPPVRVTYILSVSQWRCLPSLSRSKWGKRYLVDW